MSKPRIAFVLSTLVAVVTGLDKIGGMPIAPGPDTHFRVTSVPGAWPTWRLESDKGNLTCFVELVVQCSRPDLAIVTARVLPGDELGVQAESTPSGHLRTVLESKAPAGTRMFDWPAGSPIEVCFEGLESAEPQLVDWTLFLADDEADTRSKATWRSSWRWISLIALLISVPAALITGWPREKPEVTDPATRCVVDIIEGVEGVDAKDTERIRVLLRKVCLESAPLSEAWEAAGVTGSVERVRIWRRARERFSARLEALILALIDRQKAL